MAFKFMLGCALEYLSSQFIKSTEVSNRRTHNSKKLNILLFKTASGQRTFWIILVMWATELDTGSLSSICQPASMNNRPRETVLDIY